MERTRIRYAVGVLALGLSTMAHGQAEPSAISGVPYTPGRTLSTLPDVDGTFQYGLNAAEVVQTGYAGNGGTATSTSLSGDVTYFTKNQSRPFSLLYAGAF